MKTELLDKICCPVCHGELRLKTENAGEGKIVNGALDCSACVKSFPSEDGLPNLTYPEELAEIDLENRVFYDERPERYNFRIMLWMLKLGIISGIFERRVRWEIMCRLGLQDGMSVLETAAGDGVNLDLYLSKSKARVEVHAMDISSGMLKMAHRRLEQHGSEPYLVQGNAAVLPYKSDVFDAVFHVGAINLIPDKAACIREMCRVAKPGAKIIVCDEGVSPERAKTWLGRRIIRRCDLFRSQPLTECVPQEARDVKVFWVLQGTFWVIEFRAPETTDTGDLKLVA